MRQLTRKLMLLLVLIVAVISLTTPSPKVEASTTDCDLVGALCRLTSAVNYDICLLNGGTPTDCAYAEAVETINCIAAAGCGKPLPSKPGGN